MVTVWYWACICLIGEQLYFNWVQIKLITVNHIISLACLNVSCILSHKIQNHVNIKCTNVENSKCYVSNFPRNLFLIGKRSISKELFLWCLTDKSVQKFRFSQLWWECIKTVSNFSFKSHFLRIGLSFNALKK